MPSATTRLLAVVTLLPSAALLTSLSGCSAQQKLFGKPSSSAAWQSTYEEKKETATANTATATEENAKPITGATRYFLQLAAYTTRENAEKQLAALKKKLKQPAEIFAEQDNGQQYYKLQVGPFPTLQEAVRAEPAIHEAGFDKIRYIRR